MKFSCQQQDLIKSLNIVSKAVTSRTTIPILKGILIECDEKVKLSSSDLEISIETNLKSEVDNPGSIVVSAKLFNDIVRKLPGGEVTVTLHPEGMVRINCGNSEFNLQGLEADEFPKISEEEKDTVLSLDKELLKEMIKETCFAASIDESRGIITGALTQIRRNDITMVALDGFRMGIRKEELKSEVETDIVISARILQEIAKILSENENEEDVEIGLDDKKAVFNIDGTKVVVRLLEGDFIKYEDILPKNNRIKMKINREELIGSVERSAIIVREGKNSFIRFKMEEEDLYITSRSEEGTTKEIIPIEKEGENIEIGFNARYMTDTLKAIPDEEIVMEFNTSISPCLIKPLEGEAYEYLILPVRLSTGNI